MERLDPLCVVYFSIIYQRYSPLTANTFCKRYNNTGDIPDTSAAFSNALMDIVGVYIFNRLSINSLTIFHSP